MAKITPGPAVAAISGSVGGTTFSRNRGGMYMRNRSIPTDPNTVAQQNVRAILATQSQDWADRTNAERAAWENWAGQNPVIDTLGKSILLSGHMAYVRLNSRLSFANEGLLTVPPIINAPTALDTMSQSGDIGAGAVEITFTATPLPVNVLLWITNAVVNSAGITYIRNLLRFTGNSAGAQASTFDNQSQIEAVFGALIVGQTLHTRVATFQNTTGLMSVGLEDSVVITTT